MAVAVANVLLGFEQCHLKFRLVLSIMSPLTLLGLTRPYRTTGEWCASAALPLNNVRGRSLFRPDQQCYL